MEAIDPAPIPEKTPPKRTGWKTFTSLLGASLVGSLVMIPYSFALVRQGQATPPPGLPPELFWVIAFGVNTAIEVVLSALAIALGLWLGTGLGLGAPLLQAWLDGEPGAARRVLGSLPLAVGLGLGIGVVILLLIVVGRPLLPSSHLAVAPPAPWAGFLAAIGAGIREEVWMRLGLMTVLAWVGTRLTRRERPPAAVAWGANLLAAVAFGAIHLPQAAALAGLTAPLVGLVLLLNGLGGVAFGWLYWRRGLVAAMVAHFSTDIVLHVIAPMLPLR